MKFKPHFTKSSHTSAYRHIAYILVYDGVGTPTSIVVNRVSNSVQCVCLFHKYRAKHPGINIESRPPHRCPIKVKKWTWSVCLNSASVCSLSPVLVVSKVQSYSAIGMPSALIIIYIGSTSHGFLLQWGASVLLGPQPWEETSVTLFGRGWNCPLRSVKPAVAVYNHNQWTHEVTGAMFAPVTARRT
jgi:hypothetical protein